MSEPGERKPTIQERLLQIPPENRDLAIRIRTVFLQVIHQKEQEGVKFNSAGFPAFLQGDVNVDPINLIDKFKDYPVMQSFILEVLTDEEYESYIDKLLAK